MPTGAAPAPAAAPARPSWTELLRRILALAAPTTLLAAVQSFGQLFETWLAARQGTVALAGWAVVLPFALLLQQMSAGAMGGGVVSAIARALGAKRPDEAAALVLHALLIAVGAGLVFALVLAGFPRAVLGADRRAGGGGGRRALCHVAVRPRGGAGLAGQHPGLGAARRRAARARGPGDAAGRRWPTRRSPGPWRSRPAWGWRAPASPSR